jgi:hypothetical protein
MPPAKKTATRSTSRTASKAAGTGPITRREVERATARFDKALDDATKALTAMRSDLGTGARTAYKDVAATLKTLRRDAQKTSRTLIKDLEQLRGSVTQSKGTSRRTTRSRSSARSATKSASTSSKRSTASRRAAAK